MKPIKFIFLIILGMILLPIEILAQRIFAPSEDGILIEIKEGPKAGKFGASKKVKFPNKMPTILQEGCKIYLYSDENIEPSEIYVCQTSNVNPLAGGAFFQKNHKKFNVQKISPLIYEITLEPDFFHPITNSTDGSGWSNKIAIGYDPKNRKKTGKEEKFWYANISELDYDLDNIGKWSQEQAIESVNQLMSDGETKEQLFASIKPQQSIHQVVNGQNIQYVVVQSQPSIVPQDNNQGIQNEEKKEIISDVDKNIPYRDISNENTFALIIANEDYNKVAPVNFALRDGQKINEYFKQTLGIGKDHIAYLENATLNDMRYEVNRLSKISDAYNGEASFIIYYIGHGIPDEKNGNGYLLPVDGYGNDVTTAYSLEELYSQLSGLDAKKIVLFTDACFSGANKSGDMLVAARGIAIRSNQNEAKGHLIAFSACQGDETAYSYDEQGHGLLTYYFLKKLKDTGGQTTLGELEEYIVDNVGKTAIVINGKSQTPRVSVSPELQETWREVTFFE